MITEFVWGESRATMCIKDMIKHPGQGGQKTFNTLKQNKAIGLMQIKQYLNRQLRIQITQITSFPSTTQILSSDSPRWLIACLALMVFSPDWVPANLPSSSVMIPSMGLSGQECMGAAVDGRKIDK